MNLIQSEIPASPTGRHNPQSKIPPEVVLPPHAKSAVFRYQGKKVVGILNRPRGPQDKKFPAVLFLHGFPGSEKNVDIQRELLKRGIASYAMNFCGAWGSEGLYRFSKLTDQAVAGFRFLRSQPFVEGQRMAVFGLSMGGWTAIHLGKREPLLKAVVAVASVGGPEMIGENTRNLLADLSVPLRIGSSSALYADFVKAVRQQDPAQSVLQIKCPLLLVHGEADEVVPSSISERIYAAAHQPKELIRVPQGSHAFLERREWLTGLVSDWLQKKLSS
ncbi:MAG: alpha/beta hydrolase [Elusimicrobia bacterium]|nr:alpha/beta hydrolase [Elusimicrobiota bacterium]